MNEKQLRWTTTNSKYEIRGSWLGNRQTEECVWDTYVVFFFFCCVDGGVDGGGGGGGDPFLRTEISCKSTISERHKAHEYKK